MPETIIHAASWLVSPHAPPVADGAIVVRDGVIIDSGARKAMVRTHAVPVTDHPGRAILPGFVNAHTHLELTHFPAWRLRTHVDYSPRRFTDWLIQVVKVKRGIGSDEVGASVAEGIRICLESGTTAVGEVVNDPAQARIYRDSPLSGRLFFEVLGHDPLRFEAMLKGALSACLPDATGRLAAGISPHTTYTIAGEHLPRISRECASRRLPLAIHLSESPAETEFIYDSTGPLAEEFYPFLGWQQHLVPPRRCGSTELLDRAGLLTPATLAVHCVHLTMADAETLRRRGVSVVICPRSNAQLDVGHAPVALLRKLGIPLSLGTDSLASNDSLSMWDEMRFALKAFPQVLSPADCLSMATLGGAAALGIGATHGSLEAGKRADFQVVGHIGDGAGDLLERVLHQGVVEEVYVAGERYRGAA